MAKMRHARVCDKKWEEHKSNIQRLYLDEGRTLEGDKGVINHMKAYHNLRASKAQYERRFRKWGFRKNLKKKEWQLIGIEVERRKLAGLESKIYVFGEALSDDKVQKEILRYRNTSKGTDSHQIGRLPEGVAIGCPPDERLPSMSSDTTETESPSTMESDSEICLPSAELAKPTETSHFTASPLCMDMTLFSSRPSTPTTDFESDMLYIMSTLHQGDIEPVFTSFPTCIDLPVSSIGIIPLNTTMLYDSLQNPLLQELRTLGAQLSKLVSPSVVSKAMLILPWRAQQDLQVQSFDIIIFRQIMFLLMNNFAGSDYAAFESIFQQLKQFSISQMKEILNAIPAPYTDALQQSILTIAIKSGVAAIVKILIERGLELNRVTCRFAGSSFTPLGLACKFQQLNIVQLLLDAGVDVNQRDHSTTYTAMWHLLGFESADLAKKEEFPRATRKIFKLLLAAGAKVGWNELENYQFWSNLPLLDIYIRFSKHPTDFEYGYQLHRPLLNAQRLTDFERATCAVQRMLGENFRAEPYLGSDIEMRCLEALSTASLQGNILLVEFFLNAGFHPTVKCLCYATRGNQVDIFRLFVNLGVKIDVVLAPNNDVGAQYYHLRPYAGKLPDEIDPLLREDTVIQYTLTTPFAEAIRWNHVELIEMFEQEGILLTITERRRFTAALVAAAESGNSNMVQHLISRAKDLPELFVPALSLSISLATIGNHEQIVEMLMEAGVQPIPSSISAAIIVRNKRLIRLFLDTGISIHIPGLLWFAVRWGDMEVIQLLITAGAALNEIGWRLDFLELQRVKIDADFSPLAGAIRTGNLEIMQLLIQKGANINMEVRTDISGIKRLSPLACAVQSGNETLALELLASGADPNDPAALLAATMHSEILTRTMLSCFPKCYPSGKKYFAATALRRAIRRRDKVVVALLASYTDINDIEQRREGPDELETRIGRSLDYLPSPLGEAISGCHVGIIRILMDAGGEPNSTVTTQAPFPHRGRWTALCQAIYTGDLTIVKLIYNAGTCRSCEANLGITRTPLQLAVELGHQEIVRFLLQRGEDVKAPPCIWGGGTALQLAAIKGFVGIAELLIQYGAETNEPACRFQGRTALEGAAEYGRMDILLLLYHKGVDLISDGGEQVRRAAKLAEQSGQLAAKKLVEQLFESATLGVLELE